MCALSEGLCSSFSDMSTLGRKKGVKDSKNSRQQVKDDEVSMSPSKVREL